jgi:hypothetical protein
MSDIGKLAYVGDVWYEILDVRNLGYCELEYWLYSKDEWIPERWVKEIKSKERL